MTDCQYWYDCSCSLCYNYFLLVRFVSIRLFVCVLFVTALWGNTAHAQKAKWLQCICDTGYIADRSNDLTLRVFGLRKHISYTLNDRELKQKLEYDPNKNYNLGVGFNYRSLGINAAFNFPIVNNDNDKYGRTKSLDLQQHIYLKKLVVDVYAQWYNGFYMVNSSVLQDGSQDKIYLRPDLRTRNFGINAQYVFNGRRFSLRSPFVQNEIQKKSAGSILAGVDIHTITVRADSSIVPLNMKRPEFFDSSHFNRSNTYSLSVNGGYGYTYIFKKKYFVTAGFNVGVGINYMVTEDAGAAIRERGAGLVYNTTMRLAAGYNSEQYFVGFYYIGQQTYNTTPIANTQQDVGAGIIRIVFAKRLKLKKVDRKRMDRILPPPIPIKVP